MTKEYNDISLAAKNTLGIEVSCSRLVEFTCAEDVCELAAEGEFAPERRWNVLGGGSNMVFTRDYEGLLLHPVGKGIVVREESGDKVRVRVEAGTVWDDFTLWCADNGLWGAENLSGIPGLAGAAPVQNIGAYGAEAKDIVASVETVSTETGKTVTIAGEHCGFGYRSSIFKGFLRGKAVVTAVDFTLSRTACPNVGYGDLRGEVERLGGESLANIRRAVANIRNSKLPDPAVTGNAGSFFKNPVVEQAVADALKEKYPEMPLYPAQEAGMAKLAAGWLIDRCGWKGKHLGRAAVHDRQALVLVNRGGATGAEIMELAAAIQADVLAVFGVSLAPEVVIM